MPIDDNVEQYLSETTAATEAVKSLINIEENISGKASKVETKTDLTNNEVRIHAVLAILNDALMTKKSEFSKKCILGNLIERKERKLISKDRKSRIETVEIARQPDNIMPGGSDANTQGFIKRMFMPRQPVK